MPNKISWNAPLVRCSLHEDATRYGDGEYCVYFWQIDRTCEVFYVGCGKGYRFNDINERSRSKEFLHYISKYKCSPKIVAYGMTQKESLDFEDKLIKRYLLFGFPLVNSRSVPERETEYRKRALNKFNIGGKRIISVDEKQFEQEYKLWKSGQITAKTAMGHLGLKPNTFYRRVAVYEEGMNDKA